MMTSQRIGEIIQIIQNAIPSAPRSETDIAGRAIVIALERSGDLPGLTLDQLQFEQKAWADKNFPNQDSWVPLLGAVEEIGELAHAHIKSHQGIRGSAEKHEAKGKDAMGDILIYLAHYANGRGWSLQNLLELTWGEVRERDWIADPLKGGES